MDTRAQTSSNRNRKTIRMLAGFGLAVALIAGMIGVALRPAAAAAPTRPDSVVHWNAIALNASITVGKQNIPQSQVYLARVQAAVYNAVVAIEGQYQPYKSSLAPRPGASVDAAVAAAAHAVLVHDFPAQQGDLD